MMSLNVQNGRTVPHPPYVRPRPAWVGDLDRRSGRASLKKVHTRIIAATANYQSAQLTAWVSFPCAIHEIRTTTCTQRFQELTLCRIYVRKEKPAGAIPFAAPTGLLRGSPWGAPPRLGAMITGAG